MNFDVACDMDFYNFPFDKQVIDENVKILSISRTDLRHQHPVFQPWEGTASNAVVGSSYPKQMIKFRRRI